MGLTFHSYEPTLNGEGRELVVRKDCYSAGRWNSRDVNSFDSSTIDVWMNGSYKALFSSVVQQLMGATKFYYTPAFTAAVSSTERAVFPLSATEFGVESTGYRNQEGSELPIASVLKIAYYGAGAVEQWTRSPEANAAFGGAVWTMEATGQVGIEDATGSCYYRPTFTLPSDAWLDADLNLVEDAVT